MAATPTMADRLRGKTVAFLVATDGIERIELTEPWRAMEEAGAVPRLISTRRGRVQSRDHLEKSETFPVDDVAGEVSAENFAGLVLPGGVANPDSLRTNADAVRLVRACYDLGKPIAAICHGPWTLIEADAVRGRTLTSWPSLRTDIRNAGGTWVDEEVCVDTEGVGTLITSRGPDDLKAFCQESVEVFGA
jgi:protease I